MNWLTYTLVYLVVVLLVAGIKHERNIRDVNDRWGGLWIVLAFIWPVSLIVWLGLKIRERFPANEKE